MRRPDGDRHRELLLITLTALAGFLAFALVVAGYLITHR